MATCKKPYIPPGAKIPAPCGQCAPCLSNRKQLWTHRIMLESLGHHENSFVTLTYNDEHLPKDRSLNPDTLKKFFYRLRKRLPHKKFRYYAVGEYGTAGQRGINPHYHICLFGVGISEEQSIAKCWTEPNSKETYGYTYTGTLTDKSAAYVAGYVQKKTKYNADMYEELGLYPEFCRMSNRPGIGYSAVPIVSKFLQEHPERLLTSGDVPTYLMHGTHKRPLGKYLREKIREHMQLDHRIETSYNEHTGEIINEKKVWYAKERQKDCYKAELQDLQNNTQKDPKLPEDAKVSLKHLLAYKDKQDVLNFEARQKLVANKKTL